MKSLPRVDMNTPESQTLHRDELALCEAARQSALQSKLTFDNWMTIGRAVAALRTHADGLIEKGRASRATFPRLIKQQGLGQVAGQGEHVAAARDHGAPARGPGVACDADPQKADCLGLARQHHAQVPGVQPAGRAEAAAANDPPQRWRAIAARRSMPNQARCNGGIM